MSEALSSLFQSGREQSLVAGQALFRTGDPVRAMHLVTQGRIDLVRHSVTGTSLILSRSNPGDVVAEASAYSRHYHCDGVAVSRARVVSVRLGDFHAALDRASALTRMWAAHLAQGLQKARMQAEIRSLKTVAARLDAWLGDNASLPRKGEIQNLAFVLGVSREALYRELARRRNGHPPPSTPRRKL